MPGNRGEEFTLTGSPEISGWIRGSGPDVILCHGLSATSDYVLHGSEYLVRQGFRLVSWDARGHGQSDPAPKGGNYSYGAQVGDLDRVIDALTSRQHLFLVGHSMGSHTALAWTLRNRDRVAGLVLVGPVYTEGRDLLADDRWDQRARALEEEGPEGFADLARSEFTGSTEDQETVGRIALARARQHRNPGAVASALREVPRSRPFDDFGQLRVLDVPTLVVGSRDSHDPGHPIATAREYSNAIPGAEFVVEGAGQRPLAWQGGRLSRVIGEFLNEVTSYGGNE